MHGPMVRRDGISANTPHHKPAHYTGPGTAAPPDRSRHRGSTAWRPPAPSAARTVLTAPSSDYARSLVTAARVVTALPTREEKR